MVSQHILDFFLFNLFDLFNYRYLKINSHFFLLWLKGSQRWYSGWSDHGFKSGLPLFKPPVGRVEFSIASSPENHTGLVSIYWYFRYCFNCCCWLVVWQVFTLELGFLFPSQLS